MKFFIDSDFKCHTTNDGTLREVESDFFDGSCEAFVEGHRFVPAGEVWRREDGMTFHGEMISPWRDSSRLEAAQAQHELEQAELAAAYKEGVDSV